MPIRRFIYPAGNNNINTFNRDFYNNRFDSRPGNRSAIRPINSRLSDVFKSSPVIPFDDNSRLVFFSDCHRGDASGSDDFAHNRSLYMNAVYHYLTHGYSYVEIGDGDELWENDRFSALFCSHKDVYLLLQKFHMEGRLFMIWGNHDAIKMSERFVQTNMYDYFDLHTKRYKPLFQNLKIHEGLTLEYRGTPIKIFVVHGHQGDLLNDRLWPVSRLLVRYIWRNFQIIRGRYPFSPAENIKKLVQVENDLINWVKENDQMMIAGHTHNPLFSSPGNPPYFNTGCCTRDNYITCIEIKNGEISLIKWSRKTDSSGVHKIIKQVIGGPEKIADLQV